jgi:GST-like protein
VAVVESAGSISTQTVKHPLQLYSLATPNGVKVTIMLEELLTAGHSGAGI